MHSQFTKIPANAFDTLGESYDITSVMQYGGYGFSANGRCVMTNRGSLI